MDPLTLIILVIAALYFYSTNSIFFAFLTIILIFILVVSSSGQAKAPAGQAHAAHEEAASSTVYPPKMQIEFGSIIRGSGQTYLGDALVGTGKVITKGIGKIFSWGKDDEEH